MRLGKTSRRQARLTITRQQLRTALAEYTLGPAKRNAESAYIDALAGRLWSLLEGNGKGTR